MAEDDEDGDGPPRDPAEQRRTKLVTLSKRRLAVPSWRASRASSENNTNGCITEEEEEEMMEGSADDEDTVVTGHLSTSDSDSEAGDGFEGDPEAGRAGPGSTGKCFRLFSDIDDQMQSACNLSTKTSSSFTVVIGASMTSVISPEHSDSVADFHQLRASLSINRLALGRAAGRLRKGLTLFCTTFRHDFRRCRTIKLGIRPRTRSESGQAGTSHINSSIAGLS